MTDLSSDKNLRNFGLIHFTRKSVNTAKPWGKPIRLQGRDIWLGTRKHNVRLLASGLPAGKSEKVEKNKNNHRIIIDEKNLAANIRKNAKDRPSEEDKKYVKLKAKSEKNTKFNQFSEKNKSEVLTNFDNNTAASKTSRDAHGNRVVYNSSEIDSVSRLKGKNSTISTKKE